MRLDPSYHQTRTNIVTQKVELKLDKVMRLLRAASSATPVVKSESEHGLAARAPHHCPRTNSRTHPTPTSGRVDLRGSTWCDTTTTNCHRCGRPGHIAARCMLDMPQHVRDWIADQPYSPRAHAAELAAKHAGLAYSNFGRLDLDIDPDDPALLDASKFMRI